MLNSLLIVGTQVLILFLMIALGYFGGKIKLITDGGVKCMNDIMLYFITPCVIINAFQREFDILLFKNLLMAMLASVISHAVCLILGYIVFRNQKGNTKKILIFATTFSNCGFMALPLIESLVGKEGVFYGSGYLAIFNILVWSYGQYMMAEGSEGFEKKKIFLNPGVIATLVGLIFFFASVTLPEVIASPIASLAALNTPIPMLIIGYAISKIHLKYLFMPGFDFIAMILRLMVGPLLTLGILYAIGIRGIVLIACMCSASAPTAAITTMFTIKYGGSEEFSAKVVTLSSLFSIITMTLIVGFTQFIA